MSEQSAALNGAKQQDTGEATRLVRRFLELLADGDIDGAAELLTPDVHYINVSLPTIRGRDRVRQVLARAFGVGGAGFEVYLHSISAEDGTVLTERTDVLIFGPVRIQIWVCGRFDTADGQISMWKDYFDWLNFAVAAVRGLLGAVVPALRPRAPAGPGS